MQETRNAVVSHTTANVTIKRTPIILNITDNEDDFKSTSIDHLIRDHNWNKLEQASSTLLGKISRRSKLPSNILSQSDIMYAMAVCHSATNEELVGFYAQLRKKCKSNGILLKDVDRVVQAYHNKLQGELSKSLKEEFEQQTEQLVQSGKLSTPLPIKDIKFPFGYIPDWKNSVMLDSEGRIKFQFIPLIVESIKPADKTGGMEMTVAVRFSTEEWVNITAPCPSFFHTSKIVELTSMGFPVSTPSAVDMCKYLSEFSILNRDIIPYTSTVSQPGWYKEQFIYPGSYANGYKLDQSIREQLEDIYASSKGKKDVSLDIIKQIKSFDTSNIMLGTLLASPMVKVIRCDNIHIHICAGQGSGKTSSGYAIFSVFGNPKADLAIPKANTTDVSRELLFANRRDLPLLIEDIHSIKDSKDQLKMQRMIMEFGNNDARQRSTKDLKQIAPKMYRGSLLTTSENPLTDNSTDGGAKRRVVEIYAPSQILDPLTAERISKLAWDNYGFFGSEWINCVSNSQLEMIATYESIYHQMYDKYHDKVPRHLQSLSVVATANIYFDVYILSTDKTKAIHQEVECIEHIIQTLPSNKEISDQERAKTVIIDWFHRNVQKFGTLEWAGSSAEKEYDPRSYDTLGLIRNKYIGFNPNALKKMLQDEGFHAEMVIKQLADEGFIIKNNDNKLRKPIKLKGDKVIYLYVIPKNYFYGEG